MYIIVTDETRARLNSAGFSTASGNDVVALQSGGEYCCSVHLIFY